MLVAARSRFLAPLSACPPPLCVTGFPTQRNALLPRCLSWRQRSCDLEGLLHVAPLFVLMSVPCRIRTPLVWWVAVCGCSTSCPATSPKGPCGIATCCGAAVGTLATNFTTLVSITEPALFGLLPLRVHESTQCVSVHTGTAEFDSFFSLSQHWCRQEQKLIFISLPLPLRPGEVVWRRTRVMMFSPWREGFLADSCT